MSNFKFVAPLGTADWHGGKVKAESFRVTAAIPHINTIEPLVTCIEVLRRQTERPYIVVVDTGSPPHVVRELEQMRAEDLEIHFLAAHSYSHSSEPVTMALDFVHAVCRTPLLFHTHADCFLRRRDFIESVARICNANTPVIGYRMSPRKHSPDWEWMVGHTATMLYMPSINRVGATWSMQRMRDEFGYSLENLGGWPDTETGFNCVLRKGGIRPVFIGYDRNGERQVDDNIDHARSFAGSKIYCEEYHLKSGEWMRAAIKEAQERIHQWRIFDLIEDSKNAPHGR